MKRITLNDIDLYVTRTPVPQPCLKLADDLWLIGRLQKDELIQAAGMNELKIDFAVPAYWARDNGVNPNDYVWSYENDALFGEPVSIQSILDRLTDIIKGLL